MLRSSFLALAAATPLAPGGPTIIALGDSLALATGASHADGGFIFPAFRAVAAVHPGARLTSFAMGGATAADVLRLQVPRFARCDVAIICVGGNDVVRRTDPAAFASDLERAVMHAARSARRVLLCGVPDVGLSPIFGRDEHAAIERLSRTLDMRARVIATRASAIFIDLFSLTLAHHADAAKFLGNDRFHPSDAGYALLADRLRPALLRAIG